MEWESAVAIVASISGVVLGWAGFYASRRRDATSMSTKLATMQSGLDSCNAKLDEMSRKMDRMQEDYSGISVRLARLESDSEGMRRQHDELEGRVMRLEKRAGYQR